MILQKVLPLALILSGCTTMAQRPSWHDQVEMLAKSGRCSEARHVLVNGTDDPIDRNTKLGWIYVVCDKNNEAAVYHFNIAARYGGEFARATLARNNKPVPPADLAARNQPPSPTQQSGASAWEALNSAMGAFSAGRYGTSSNSGTNRPSSPSFSECDVRSNTMGANVGMDQRYNINCR